MLYFIYNGTEYAFDRNKMALKEGIEIKELTGLGLAAFETGITDLDPLVLQAMVWLGVNRSGTALRFQDVDFDIYELIRTIRYEQLPGEQVDPPSGQPTPTGSDSGTTPSDDAPNTSELSPTT